MMRGGAHAAPHQQQRHNNGRFPLERYLIRCERVIRQPYYLRRNIAKVYDFNEVIADEADKLPDTQSRLQIGRGDEVPWPTPEQLGLDYSQFASLRAALTQEISIIQGPPGTGKTFVGLKIVKMLNSVTTANEKMLIVCYTNHALDQFLEGILSFCPRGVLRIGGRCKSEILQSCMLAEKRKNLTSQRTAAIRKSKYDVHRDMDQIKDKLTKKSLYLSLANKHILKLNDLKTFMHPRLQHFFESLYFASTATYDSFTAASSTSASRKNEFVIRDWLLQMNTSSMAAARSPLHFIVDDVAEQIIIEEAEENAWSKVVECLKDIIEGNDANEVIEAEYENRFYEDMMILDDGSGRKHRKDNLDNNRETHAKNLRKLELDENYDLSWFDEQQNAVDEEGFQMVGPKKKVLGRMIKNKLMYMPDQWTLETAEELENRCSQRIYDNTIHNLRQEQKWTLYHLWLYKYKENLLQEISEEKRQFNRASDSLGKLSMVEDGIVMNDCKIIGMTTTGAARYGHVLSTLQPKIVVVEEAAEVFEAHVVTSLSAGCEHLILIGDHQQLRPNPAVFELAKFYNLDLSLFERLINNQLPHCVLTNQHRMRPEISRSVRFIYPELVDDPCVMNYEAVPGITNSIYFFNHDNAETYREDMKSYSNKFEANMCARLCKYLLNNGILAEKITILTLYASQMFSLQELMPRNQFQGVRIFVVDNYQGKENDIIVLSMVRSNNENKAGFTKIENRICVALSRAKQGLYVFGNFDLMASQSELWTRIVKCQLQHGAYGSELRFQCQNHPETFCVVKVPEDFDKCPEGGCKLTCGERLACGHQCRKICHPIDREHKNYKCLEKCARRCVNDHPCQSKCYMECPECRILVEKKIPKCGHIQKIPCFMAPEDFKCQEKCSKTLSKCGHPCSNQCGEACSTNKCSHPVPVFLEFCGHTTTKPCHFDARYVLCQADCPAPRQSCDHQPCGNRCGECGAGRLHQDCRKACGRSLICGHKCRATCPSDCPPCTAPCNECCTHNACQKLCGSPCHPCNERCGWVCEHAACSRLCSEACDRERCAEPCRKPAPPCKRCAEENNNNDQNNNENNGEGEAPRQCIGMCGEKCPELCACHDKETLTECFFGMEDDEDARFITLQTCGHTFEVSGLDYWFDNHGKQTGSDADSEGGEEDVSIEALACPKCKTLINKTSCWRYINVYRERQHQIKRIQAKRLDGGEAGLSGNAKSRRNSNEGDSRYDESWMLEFAIARMQEVGGLFNAIENFKSLLPQKQQPISGADRARRAKFAKWDISNKLALQAAYKQLEALWTTPGFEAALKHEKEQQQKEKHKAGEKQSERQPTHLIKSLWFLLRWLAGFPMHSAGRPFAIQQRNVFAMECKRMETLATAHTTQSKLAGLNGGAIVNREVMALRDRCTALIGRLEAVFVFTQDFANPIFREYEAIKKIAESYVPGLGITKLEQEMIIRATPELQGHWRQCPNGHLYAIGECGGAMERGRCNECKAGIGGEHHCLDPTNTESNLMDRRR